MIPFRLNPAAILDYLRAHADRFVALACALAIVISIIF